MLNSFKIFSAVVQNELLLLVNLARPVRFHMIQSDLNSTRNIELHAFNLIICPPQKRTLIGSFRSSSSPSPNSSGRPFKINYIYLYNHIQRLILIKNHSNICFINNQLIKINSKQNQSTFQFYKQFSSRKTNTLK